MNVRTGKCLRFKASYFHFIIIYQSFYEPFFFGNLSLNQIQPPYRTIYPIIINQIQTYSLFYQLFHSIVSTIFYISFLESLSISLSLCKSYHFRQRSPHLFIIYRYSEIFYLKIFHFLYLTRSYFSLLFLNYYFFFLLKLERSQFNQQMDIKVREALSNLAKQPPNPNLKKPDPLSIICAQRKKMRKTKVIQKQHMKREKKKGKNTKLQNQQSQNKIKVEKQEINQTKMDLQKYLPKQCDQFLDMERNEKKNDQDSYKIQNSSNLPELNEGKKPKLSPMKQEKAIMPQIDYQLLKTQLGIGIKDEPKVKIEQKPVLAKQECPNPLLPFPGRAFEQAPPRPAPKKICEYPPTDKVAGLYPWPPPQSDYRRWKNQMRESRKLE